MSRGDFIPPGYAAQDKVSRRGKAPPRRMGKERAVYELIKITDRAYYISCPAKIGVYDTGEGVYLIDSGSDKDAGRRARKALDEQGNTRSSVLVTHSNADHIGGCQYLQRQTGCKVFAPGIEAQFTRSPILEPSFLFGAYPPKPLRHKFLMAQPCACLDVTDSEFPKDVHVLPLPGHFFDQCGYMLPDGTAFIADCVSSPETLEKYVFPFVYDVAAYLDTLDRLPGLGAKRYVPAHAEPCEDIRELAGINKRHMERLAEDILRLCAEPRCFEEILKLAFDENNLTLDFQQYVLVGSTIRSFLAWHLDAGRVSAEFTGNRLIWRRA